MNPRRAVVEDRALALADALRAEGRERLAQRLSSAVPETFGLCDEHVPVLRDALAAVAAQADPKHGAAAAQVVSALDDLPRYIGRRGRVMVGRDQDGAYSAMWEDGEWLEEGPTAVRMDAILAWAERRSGDVRLPADE